MFGGDSFASTDSRELGMYLESVHEIDYGKWQPGSGHRGILIEADPIAQSSLRMGTILMSAHSRRTGRGS